MLGAGSPYTDRKFLLAVYDCRWALLPAKQPQPSEDYEDTICLHAFQGLGPEFLKLSVRFQCIGSPLDLVKTCIIPLQGILQRSRLLEV